MRAFFHGGPCAGIREVPRAGGEVKFPFEFEYPSVWDPDKSIESRIKVAIYVFKGQTFSGKLRYVFKEIETM